MYRFFVNEKKLDYFVLDQSILNHLKSIRLKPNENFICIYQNQFYLCALEGKNAKILNPIDQDHEYEHQLIIFAPIIKIKHFEWMIQKATELGAKAFYPLITKNTNPKYIQMIEQKLARFQEIAKNAAEQSFRNQIMHIYSPIHFDEAIKIEITNKFLAHEQIDTDDKKTNFSGDLAFFVGPEGGFTDEEVELAKKNNTQIVSLGKRILRAETAIIWLLANVN